MHASRSRLKTTSRGTSRQGRSPSVRASVFTTTRYHPDAMMDSTYTMEMVASGRPRSDSHSTPGYSARHERAARAMSAMLARGRRWPIVRSGAPRAYALVVPSFNATTRLVAPTAFVDTQRERDGLPAALSVR